MVEHCTRIPNLALTKNHENHQYDFSPEYCRTLYDLITTVGKEGSVNFAIDVQPPFIIQLNVKGASEIDLGRKHKLFHFLVLVDV